MDQNANRDGLQGICSQRRALQCLAAERNMSAREVRCDPGYGSLEDGAAPLDPQLLSAATSLHII